MTLDRLDRRGLAALEAAVRRGEPVSLGPAVCARVPMDELVPFFHDVADDALRPLLAPAARPATAPAAYRVTAVIPASRHRPIGLVALAAQDVEVEPLVLANGAFTEGVRVPWEGHGPTRQRGVELATGDYVLFTVDDALPLGAGFVRTLVEALEAGGYDAVTARQVPWPTADPVTRARLRAWTPPPGAPVPAPPLDHVAALYRRETLLRDPLPDVPIAEDWVWGRTHRVGYVAAAPIAHSHPRTFRASYHRTRAIHRVMHTHGSPPTVPDLPAFFRALPGVVGRDVRGALGELLGQLAATG